MIDVPKESPYGLIYNLALAVGTWDHPLLEGCVPLMPYPIELVRQAGFENLTFSQTLVASPCYSHLEVEEPCEGYDRGSYVAITAYKY